MDFNPNARLWHDLREPLDIIEEQRGTREKALEMQQRTLNEIEAEKAAQQQEEIEQREKEKARQKKVQEEIEAEKKAGGYAYGGAIDPEKPWKDKYKSQDGNYLYKTTGSNGIQDYANSSVRRTLKGFITGASKPKEISDTKYIPAKFQDGGAMKRVKILSLPKAQYGLNQNFDTSYDTSKNYAENLELNKRAQAMGWNSVADYQKSNWGRNPNTGFAYKPDASTPQGPQLAAPQLQNVQRNIAASKSAVGPTKVNAALANENATLNAERLEKNRQSIEANKNRSIYDEDAAGLPSVPIFEAALMAPVALSSLGAAGTAIEAIPEVAGAL